MRASFLLGLPLCIAFTSYPALPESADATGAVRTRIEGIDIPSVPNAPFAAKVVVTWDEPLVGGGTVSRTYYTMVARDSQGRVHRETREFVPANSNTDPLLRSITINDPIAGTRTVCMQASMNCSTGAFNPRIALVDDEGGALPVSNGNLTRTSLGQQTMDGLPVTGTRETRTSIAGSNGSSRVAVGHTDVWYSPDLQMDLLVIRDSPQMGHVALSVTDLVRGEPARSWFAVPSGYEVKNARNQ
jgi:hypothetical protein